ncbi:MAG: phage integrase N-terminal SAM-like domain-containing protein [Arcobacteraceae bacterium]|nr:phage integrase N-terminal SAM-like domain-containing protein [Arcobacteraceae bacterium]
MFELSTKDYKLLFEYEEMEELQEILNKALKFQQEIQKVQLKQETEDEEKIFNKVEKPYQIIEQDRKLLTFEMLENEFIAYKKRTELSKSTYKNYQSAFSKLKKYFINRDIQSITLVEFENFQRYLREDEKLADKTTNNIIQYTKYFCEFAIKRGLVEGRINIEGVDYLRIKKKSIEEKGNYEDWEIRKILDYIWENESKLYYIIFKIAIYTGMRQNEIISIKESDIKEDRDRIKYIDIRDSKTNSGIRKVPLHKELLADIDLFKLLYEIDGDKEINKYGKRLLIILYKVIKKGEGKNFHTFRGTFIQKAVNKFPEKLHLVKEIIGHSKGSDELTLGIYSKEFYLGEKLKIVNSVRYY